MPAAIWAPRPDGDAHPPGLRPSAVPLAIVCGAPCSGKSAFVVANAGAGDLVIDLDAIAAGLARTSAHGWDRKAWLAPALRARNALLASLADADPAWPAAWFIVVAPDPAERRWWSRNLAPRRVVAIETDADACLDRLFADDERRANRSSTVVAINEWWRRYRRGPGETIVAGARGG